MLLRGSGKTLGVMKVGKRMLIVGILLVPEQIKWHVRSTPRQTTGSGDVCQLCFRISISVTSVAWHIGFFRAICVVGSTVVPEYAPQKGPWNWTLPGIP